MPCRSLALRRSNLPVPSVLSLCVRLLLLALLGGNPGPLRASEVSFRNDVMAVLSKAGCNMGTCHGNKNGKGGLKLSLRGEDPAEDYRTLTRELIARRANLLEPDSSLLLLKPTMQVPHEGDRRFGINSREYRVLREWIAAGMPDDSGHAPRLVGLEVTPREQIVVQPEHSVRLRAVARFSNGERRDVTSDAVYEPAAPVVRVAHDGLAECDDVAETTVIVRYLDRQVPVRLMFVPARPDFEWTGPSPANYVDEHVFAKLRKLRIHPSEDVSDVVFLRRAYVDLLGIIPTADEARRFIEDPREDKRSRLVDELLERPEFAEFWALKWSDLLRNEEKTLDFKGVQNFHAWIRRSIAENKPLDRFARELIAARGSTYENPPANYYRAMRDPIMRAESAAQVFLGIRLQCAKCHNHPFDRWTQDDYYGWANVFARVDYKILENRRLDRNDGHEFDGEQVVYMKPTGDVNDPRTGRPLPPKFLGDADAKPAANEDRLLALADWVARGENRLFVEVQVNRIWYHLMGRGIVDPIDDFRATNPPVNPPLLDALVQDFIDSGFDLKHMIRVIMSSRTYQLSTEPNETNVDDSVNFSRALVRRLPAETLLDSLAQVADVPLKFNGYPEGTRAGALAGVQAVRPRDRQASLADQFLKVFGKPMRLQSCECERSDEATLSQTFDLISGPFMEQLLTHSENRLAALLTKGAGAEAIVDELYWAALSRAPQSEERETAVRHLSSSRNLRTASEDLLWGLLNSHEFMFRP